MKDNNDYWEFKYLRDPLISQYNPLQYQRALAVWTGLQPMVNNEYGKLVMKETAFRAIICETDPPFTETKWQKFIRWTGYYIRHFLYSEG